MRHGKLTDRLQRHPWRQYRLLPSAEPDEFPQRRQQQDQRCENGFDINSVTAET
jgi:hypothetical protein